MPLPKNKTSGSPLEETRAAPAGGSAGATVSAGGRTDEAEVKKAEGAVALEWKPGDVILGLYEVRRVTEGLGEDAEEKDYHEGGFGRVYKVFHRGWNMELAVKTPRREAFDSEAKKANFLRECETWIGLGLHPHVASCFYVRELGGVPRVFSEYAGAGTLSDWIRYRRLYEGDEKAVLARMLDIAIQFAWGLHHAHEQGLVHQDVKPLNLLMMQDETAKVTDFGLARARALPEGENVTGGRGPGTVLVAQAGGMTPAYCSPEQAAGGKLTRRTDVWSWAVSFLEMFQGGASWQSGVLAGQALEAFLQHNGGEEGIPGMPDGVAALLRRCFRQGPDERPHDMLEVVRDLATAYQAAAGKPYPRPDPKAAADSPDSLNNRGVSMQDIGRLDEAERLWSEALKHDPMHLAATYNLGLLQWRAARIADDEVLRRLEQARKAQPTPRAGYLLALAHAERLDYESAVRELEQAAAADAGDVEIGELLRRLAPLRDRGVRCLHAIDLGEKERAYARLSADGMLALTGGDSVRLWDVASGRCLRTLEAPRPSSVAFSRNGRLAISGGCRPVPPPVRLLTDGSIDFSDAAPPIGREEQTVRLWDVATGRCLRSLGGHSGQIHFVWLRPDGRIAVSTEGFLDHLEHKHTTVRLRLWDVTLGRCLHICEWPAGGGHASFSDDGSRALFMGDHTLEVWDVATDRSMRSLESPGDRPKAWCLGADGRLAFAGGDDRVVRLFDVASGKALRTFNGHLGAVSAVAMSDDGRLAISGDECIALHGREATARLWDLATGRCLHTLAASRSDWVTAVSLSADGRVALFATYDGTLRFCETGSPDRRQTAPAEISRAVSAQQAVDLEARFAGFLDSARVAAAAGRFPGAVGLLRQARAVAGHERDAHALDLANELAPHCRRVAVRGAWLVRTCDRQDDRVSQVALSADGRLALSWAERDCQLWLWDLATGKRVRSFMGNMESADVCLTADGRFALSGDQNGFLRLWEVATGRCVREYAGHTGPVWTVHLGSDQRLAISGGKDTTLRLWDVATGRCLRTLEGHAHPPRCVRLSADGRLALSGNHEEELRLWSVAEGRCLRVFGPGSTGVNAVCLTPGGRLGVSGGLDNMVRAWDLESGECLRTMEGHTALLSSLSPSADGQALLSGSFDKTVRVWDVASGGCLCTLEATDEVGSACLSASGRFVLAGDRDGTLRLWELDWELEWDPKMSSLAATEARGGQDAPPPRAAGREDQAAATADKPDEIRPEAQPPPTVAGEPDVSPSREVPPPPSPRRSPWASLKRVFRRG